jgi:hypothetical protein
MFHIFNIVRGAVREGRAAMLPHSYLQIRILTGRNVAPSAPCMVHLQDRKKQLNSRKKKDAETM